MWLTDLWHSFTGADMIQKQLDYMKEVQQKEWERQDTAYQRTVNDMQKAGLSPLSMTSTNASGALIDTQASGQAQADSKMQAFNSAIGAISSIASVAQQVANIQKTNAETRDLNSPEHLDNLKLDNFSKFIDTMNKSDLRDFTKSLGLPYNASPEQIQETVGRLHTLKELGVLPNDLWSIYNNDNMSSYFHNGNQWNSHNSISDKDLYKLAKSSAMSFGFGVGSNLDKLGDGLFDKLMGLLGIYGAGKL